MRELKPILSVKNPLIAESRKLESAKERRAQNAFLLDGEHMVTEALSVCPERVHALFIREGDEERFAALIAAAGPDCECCRVSASVMESLSQVRTTQGIAAVCGLPPVLPPESLHGHVVLLENVQDPGNVGTILRTADAAGFTGAVLTPGCADPFSPKGLRATMGSIFRVPVVFAESAETVRFLNGRGFATLGASLKGSPYYDRGALPENLCLLIGNEGQGLTDEVQGLCTHLFRLPMHGGAESLNAAIAAAVLMYDLMNR